MIEDELRELAKDIPPEAWAKLAQCQRCKDSEMLVVILTGIIDSQTQLILGLAERCAKQSELLGRRAEGVLTQ